MTLQQVRITHADEAGHEAFLRYTPRIFPSADFRRWHERGGWTSRYEAHALVETGEIVANVSVMQMRLVIDGREVRGAQLGAVGCLPEMRGRGLVRLLLERVLAQLQSEADLIYLHANDEVLDFYPRFGFRRVQEWVFDLELALDPAPSPATRLDLDDPSQREAWLAACAGSLPPSERFGVRDYGSVALWHASNLYSRNVHALREGGAYAVVVQEGDTLHLLDLAAPGRFDLRPVLPSLIQEPIKRVRFGFCPELWSPAARAVEPCDDAFFVLGGPALPSKPFRLPMLAET